MDKTIRIKEVQDDLFLSAFNGFGNYMDSLPKSVVERFRENTKKYAGTTIDGSELWKGIEDYQPRF